MNHIEWIITIGVFLSFVVWSLSFYFSFFPDEPTLTPHFADLINEDIKEFLFVETYAVPIKFNSSVQEPDQEINFTYTWPVSSNTIRIYNSTGSTMPCIISGDVIYFQTNTVNTTYNFFRMTYSNLSMSARCTGSFGLENATEVVPFSAEMIKLISQNKINEMTNQSYDAFKQNLSISHNFRIEINESGTETNFGPTLPQSSNIYVRETFTKMEESGQDVDMRVLVW